MPLKLGIWLLIVHKKSFASSMTKVISPIFTYGRGIRKRLLISQDLELLLMQESVHPHIISQNWMYFEASYWLLRNYPSLPLTAHKLWLFCNLQNKLQNFKIYSPTQKCDFLPLSPSHTAWWWEPHHHLQTYINTSSFWIKQTTCSTAHVGWAPARKHGIEMAGTWFTSPVERNRQNWFDAFNWNAHWKCMEISLPLKFWKMIQTTENYQIKMANPSPPPLK